MASSSYSNQHPVGDLIIDWHRRQLTEAASELSRLLEAPSLKAQEVSRFFSTLAVYLLDRFGFEQKRLAKAGESERIQHQGDYAALIRQIRSCQMRVNAGDVDAVKELLPVIERACQAPVLGGELN